jgi:UDP-glucose 4-epimerase
MQLQDKTVLVTGGAGFIGSQVSADLLAAGADVHVLDNCFAGEAGLVPEGARFTETDVCSAAAAERIRGIDPDALVHLAAIHYIPYCNEHPREAFEVNVMGTRNVLEAARDLSGLESVVLASTAAVYPPREGPNREDSELAPMDIYGETKLVDEDLLELFARETGTTAAAARLFNVYGPNETNPHLIPAILDQLDGSRRVELGNLSPKRDFVHVRDVSDALLTLLSEFEGGFRPFNVGTGEAHSVREVAAAAGDALGAELTIEQDTERVRESDRPHLEADVSRLTAETSWEPSVSLVEGLAELVPEANAGVEAEAER